MKILIINTLYYPNIVGGAERSTQFLAEALAQKGHQPVVVAGNSQAGIRVDEVGGVRVYRVGVENVYWPFTESHAPGRLSRILWHVLDMYNPLMRQHIDRIISMEKPDVVHTNNLSCFSVAVWPLVRARNLPLVHTIRDYYLLCPRCTMFSRNANCETQCALCWVHSWPSRRYSHCVDTVVGVSRFVLEKHLDHGLFPRARTRVIHNAYEISRPPDSGDARAPRRPMRFGYIGSISRAKGVDILLEACRTLPEGLWELFIAGRAKRECRGDSIGNANVTYMGFIPSEEFFPQIDVLVVPSSWHDPLPRTVFEAYAWGVPVIGSRRGGIPELIENGKTGFLFDPARPEELSQLMNAILRDPGLVLGMRADCLGKAAEFAPPIIADQYLSAYQEAIQSH